MTRRGPPSMRRLNGQTTRSTWRIRLPIGLNDRIYSRANPCACACSCSSGATALTLPWPLHPTEVRTHSATQRHTAHSAEGEVWTTVTAVHSGAASVPSSHSPGSVALLLLAVCAGGQRSTTTTRLEQ